MKSLLLSLLLVVPAVLPLSAHKRRAAKKTITAPATPAAPLRSDTAVLPPSLHDAVILGCVHSGHTPHVAALETPAATSRTAASTTRAVTTWPPCTNGMRSA